MAASLKGKIMPITTPPYQVLSVDITTDPPIFSLVTTFKSKFRLVTLGLSGIRVIGSVAVGLTEFEIEVPILEKNLLNSSAIHEGSEICFPSTTIFSIFVFCLEPTVASFKISHVFFGFFTLAFKLSSKYLHLLLRISVL